MTILKFARIGGCALVSACLMTACIEDGSEYELSEESEEMGEVLAPEEDEEVGTSQDAFLGADLCKDVDITITNSRDRAAGNVAIKVLKLEMYSVQDGKWRSEDIANRIVDYGMSVKWNNVDLENIYYETISKWKIFYKVLQSNGTWGSRVYQIYDDNPAWFCTNYGSIGLVVN